MTFAATDVNQIDEEEMQGTYNEKILDYPGEGSPMITKPNTYPIYGRIGLYGGEWGNP